MTDGLNQVTLFGNLGADPELKPLASGPVLKMRLATSITWFNKEKNRKEDRTEWHNLTMFGRRAESLSKHLRKGSKILVQGHLRTSSFERDGQKHQRTEVIVDELCFAGSRSNGAFLVPEGAATVASTAVPF